MWEQPAADSWLSGPWSGNGAASWREEEDVERAVRESLRSQLEPQPGSALQVADLQKAGLYYEHQHPSSDTCGLNALNNLCQRAQFKLADLQRAEAKKAQAQDGGSFAQMAPVHTAPSGFFDVEALKIAADAAAIEVVEVEPVLDYRRSRCHTFAESASTSPDGSWFLGFLVYDRRPGQMHYYTLLRDGRYKGIWVKLDSQVAAEGEEPRNRMLREQDLWSLYEASRFEFQAWLMRWYPVVHRGRAVKEVCRALAAEGYQVSEARAQRALQDCGWAVGPTVHHLLKGLPKAAVQELLVKFARPSEAEMRALLEAAQWDVAKARPAIDHALGRRIALAKGAADVGGGPRRALSLCDWQPGKAATLLALQLQLGAAVDALPELQQALEMAGYDVDRAEAVLKLQPAVPGLADAVKLLEQTGDWSVTVAQRILQVHRRFPRVAVAVALEVLRRNDDDPHAACEMLAEYERRVQRLVAQSASGELFQGEEVAIAEAALSSADWDPSRAFVMAENLAFAVQQTRRLVKRKGVRHFLTIDVLVPALAAADLKPNVAATSILGAQFAAEAASHPTGGTSAGQGPTQIPCAPARRRAAPAPREPAKEEEQDEMCSVM